MNHVFYWRFICECDRIGLRDSCDLYRAWCADGLLDNNTEQAMNS